MRTRPTSHARPSSRARPIRHALRLPILAAVLLAHVGVAGAQAPTITPDPDPNRLGQYVVTIVTPPVLDYGRTTTLDADGNVTTTVLTQSTRGRIKGTSTTRGPVINGDGTLSGRVGTRQSQPFVLLRSVEHGDIGGDATLSVIRMAARLDGWGEGSRLVGQLAQRFCMLVTDPIRNVKKKICSGNNPGIDLAAPHLGTWEARLALDTSGSRVIGAGSIATAVRAGGTRVSTSRSPVRCRRTASPRFAWTRWTSAPSSDR